MADDALVTHGEWNKWAKYFGAMFPTASKEWIEQMCQRMIHTLSHEGETWQMGGLEYYARLEQLSASLKALPPDPNNRFMGGIA